MYESLQINTNGTFLKKVSKMNPQIKSLRFGLANQDLRVLKSRFVWIWELLIQILRILSCYSTKDLWGFIGFVKTGWIIWKIAGFMVQDTKRIFSIQDSWSTIQNKSGFVVYKSIQIHGLAKQIHGSMISWYDSRNLSKES